MTRSFVLVCALAASAVLVARADRYEVPAQRTPFSVFPMQVGEWTGHQEPPFSADVLKILGVDDYLTRTYFAGNVGLGLYVGYWQSQRQGDTIHSPLNCMPGAGWQPEVQQIVPLDDPTGQRRGATLNRVLIRKGLDRQLVLYWYQSHGRVVGSEYRSKFFMVADAVRLNRSDGAIVRVTTPVQAGTEDASERRARNFVHALLPALEPFLPR